MKIGKNGDREDHNDDHVRCAEDLPRVFAVQFQDSAAELRNVLRTAVSIEVEIIQKGAFVEALEDFIREIVVANGQPVPDDIFDRVDAEISVDALEGLPCTGSPFGRPGKQIAIEQGLDLHMPDQQLEGFARGKVLDAQGYDAIDQSSFESPGSPMEQEFQRNQENPKEEE